MSGGNSSSRRFILIAAGLLGLILNELGQGAAAQTQDDAIRNASAPEDEKPRLIIDCRVKGNCSTGVLGGRLFLNTYAYAYAPAMILDAEGTAHYFFCSSGDGQGLDAIRYVSVSAKTGPVGTKKPIVVVRSTPTVTADGGTEDLAACDPSIVRFKGPKDDKPYYYLHYTSAIKRPGYKSCAEHSQDGNPPCKDVIQVARSEHIAGPYLVLKENGVWGAPGVATKIILQSFGSHWRLGLAQQSVMVVDGKLVMFYGDDTDSPHPPHRPWYMIESDDPTTWDRSIAQEILLPAPIDRDDKSLNSGDVKYDPLKRQFVLVSTAPSLARAPKNTFLQVSSSADGIHWKPWTLAIPSSQFPNYAHNPGTLSDDKGWIIRQGGKFSFGFAANPDLSSLDTRCPPKPGSGCDVWNLYQVNVPDNVEP